MSHDFVIRNGNVIDGTGNEPFEADVAVDGDQISAIGVVSDRRTRVAGLSWIYRPSHALRRANRLGPASNFGFLAWSDYRAAR